MMRGLVHDPTARRMGGVAGHAGLFSTGDDLSIFVRMLLEGGTLARRADSVAAERRDDDPARDAADDDGAARVGVGHRLGVLVESRGAAADRVLRPHGIHGHVHLGGPADWRLDRVPVEPRASRRPRRRDGAPRAGREHRGVRGSRRPTAAVDRNDRRRPYVAGHCRVAGPRARPDRHRRAARRRIRAAERAARRAAHEPERARERRDVHDRSASRREGSDAGRALQPGARHSRRARRERAVVDRRRDGPADLLALRRDASADRRRC